jgi:Tfp pilus assembly protein PilX
MNAALALIFLSIISGVTASALNQQMSNEKMSTAAKAHIIAFNSAEAGLIAEEARQNGENVNLSDIKGELNYSITSDTVNNCQEHTLTIISTAIFQNARVKLAETYLKTPQTPPPGCMASVSHRLAWQELDWT